MSSGTGVSRGGSVAAIGGVRATLLAGCGGGFPAAAEPADSPPLAGRPAGEVAAIGALPEGMAFLPRAGLLAVGLRDPSALGFVDPASMALVGRVALPATPRHIAAVGRCVVRVAVAERACASTTPAGSALSARPPRA